MKKRLADKSILTRKLYIYKWHLLNNNHIPWIKEEMEKKISAIKLQYSIAKDFLTVDGNRKISNPFLAK